MSYWERPILKARAKDVLRKYYWASFGVAAVIALILSYGGGEMGVSLRGDGGNGFYEYVRNLYPWNWDGSFAFQEQLRELWAIVTSWQVSVFVLVISLLILAFRVVLQVFVLNHLIVGRSRFFSMTRYQSVSVDHVFFPFRKDNYSNTVRTMMYPTIYLTLWGLIPVVGWVICIVKSLSYFMVPYIAAENPHLSAHRVLEISKKTTEGEKGEMFVFWLSFIGWFLLGLCACGIGVFFVIPYLEASKAELYGALRYKAVMAGIASREEIGADLE